MQHCAYGYAKEVEPDSHTVTMAYIVPLLQQYFFAAGHELIAAACNSTCAISPAITTCSQPQKLHHRAFQTRFLLLTHQACSTSTDYRNLVATLFKESLPALVDLSANHVVASHPQQLLESLLPLLTALSAKAKAC